MIRLDKIMKIKRYDYDIEMIRLNKIMEKK